MSARLVIAIDGPAGSGKSTLAERLASHLGLPYVNTGTMYRAVALEARRREISPDDAHGLEAIARSLRFDLSSSTSIPVLHVDGELPRWDLSSQEVEGTVSRVSSHPEVRAVLRTAQRRLGAGGGVIEGRDIGSIVFPDAEVKVFLDAAPEVRASRRIEERTGVPRRSREGEEPIAEALAARNAADERTTPFVPAVDALVLDTSTMSADEVFDAVLDLVRNRTDEGSDPSRP
ncbi:MAG: (d)CMP kinase [Actinomycetota bacterium]